MGKKSKVENGKKADGLAIAKPRKSPSTRTVRTKVEAKEKTSGLTKSRKAASPTSKNTPSDEEIRLRAYFIAERRAQLRLEGDSTHDWLEARRQLIDEATRRDT